MKHTTIFKPPLVIIYNDIEDLKQLAIAVRNQYSQTQLVQFGLEILRNTHGFEDGLKVYITTSSADLT